MNLFLINLAKIGVVGLIVLVWSFTRFTFECVKPNWIAFCTGALLLLSVIGGVIYTIASPPGREKTDVVEIDEDQKGDLESAHIQRLAANWDSEDRVPNWPVAETMAMLSDYAYLPPFNAEQKFRELGFSDCVAIVQGSMIGYVVSSEDSTVIVFRGTDFVELSDWLSNVDTAPFHTPHGKIHNGFYGAYHAGEADRYFSMKQQIDEVLAQAKPKRLWICGHSLGGALALVCAYDLEENEGREIDGMMTFGQPLLVRQKLADYLDDKFVGRYARFAVGEDLVTKIAPGHSYCGSLVHFRDGGIKRSKPKRLLTYSTTNSEEPTKDENEIEPMTEEDLNELLKEMGRLPREQSIAPDARPLMTGAAMIEDHSMKRYLEKIRELFK